MPIDKTILNHPPDLPKIRYDDVMQHPWSPEDTHKFEFDLPFIPQPGKFTAEYDAEARKLRVTFVPEVGK